MRPGCGTVSPLTVDSPERRTTKPTPGSHGWRTSRATRGPRHWQQTALPQEGAEAGGRGRLHGVPGPAAARPGRGIARGLDVSRTPLAPEATCSASSLAFAGISDTPMISSPIDSTLSSGRGIGMSASIASRRDTASGSPRLDSAARCDNTCHRPGDGEKMSSRAVLSADTGRQSSP